MKFFSPQVQLVETVRAGQASLFAAHIVVFCNGTRYEKENVSVDTSRLQSDNLLVITISVKENPNTLNFDYITPLAFTVDLGEKQEFTRPAAGWIRTKVVCNALNGNGNHTPNNGGTTTLSSTDADNKSRPIAISEL